MDFLFLKSPTGLTPACEEAADWLKKKKLGATILVEPREMRNGKFHRKWFALVRIAFDYWEETVAPIEYKGVQVKPNFRRFRKDITIMAGFFEPVVNAKGELRLEAESLQWASMTEERFTQLYDATVATLLAKILTGPQWNEYNLRQAVQQISEFAA